MADVITRYEGNGKFWNATKGKAQDIKDMGYDELRQAYNILRRERKVANADLTELFGLIKWIKLMRHWKRFGRAGRLRRLQVSSFWTGKFYSHLVMVDSKLKGPYYKELFGLINQTFNYLRDITRRRSEIFWARVWARFQFLYTLAAGGYSYRWGQSRGVHKPKMYRYSGSGGYRRKSLPH